MTFFTDGDVETFDAEFQDLRATNATRLDRYQKFRDEIGRSRDWDPAGGATDTTDYGRNRTDAGVPKRHNVQLPFAQALTVKHAFRISGRMPEAIVDKRFTSPQEKHRSDTMEKIWWSVIRNSGDETLFAGGAWDGSQLGSACFDLYFDVRRQQPVIRSIDPGGILVVPGLDDRHDYQRVYKFWDVPLRTLRAEYKDKFLDEEPIRIGDITSTHKDDDLEMVTLVQMTDRNRHLRWASGSKVRLWGAEHKLSFVPYVVIPNLGPDREIWGWADYEFYRSIAQYLPVLFSREADIIRSVSNGTYIEKATGQDPQAIKKVLSTGGVVPSRRDGELEPVGVPEAPQFETSHASTALQYLKMLGFAPDAAWGEGQSQSGSDRNLQLQPLIELTSMKQMNWQRGLGRLGSLAFRMLEQLQTSKTTFFGTRPSRTGSATPFAPAVLGPDLDPIDASNSNGMDEAIQLPRTPKELFGGEYQIRFTFRTRVDPDDPAFVLAELNKFQQGAQSLQTTLERLGVQAPEEEIKLIEDESERFPWLRSGMVQLVKAQLAARGGTGTGGGPGADPAGGLAGALATSISPDGQALDTDAGAAALPGDSPGALFGAA